MAEVTDPALLAQLNGPKEVTDPKLLEQLNAQEDTGGIAKTHSPLQAATNVGLGTTIGGVAGAFAPELVTLAGMGASLFPGGALVGVPLMGVGRAMRVGRLAGAISGAIAGGVGSSAAEAARASGTMSETGVNAVEFGAGMVAPTGLVTSFVPKGAKAAWTVVQNLSEKLPASTNRAEISGKALIRAQFGDKVPEHDLHALLKQGVEADAQATEQAANAIMAKAHAEAAKVHIVPGQAQQPRYTAPTKVDEIMKSAQEQVAQLRKESAERIEKINRMTQGRLAATERIGKQAEHELHNTVGKPQELSDVGKQLTEKIHTNQQQVDKVREQTDHALRAERDRQVAVQESQGKFMKDTPEVKSLLQEIDTKLLSSAKGREASRVTVTSPGKLDATQTEALQRQAAYLKGQKTTRELSTAEQDMLAKVEGKLAKGGPSQEKVGRAAVTEPGVARAYSNVKEAIADRKIAVAWDPETGVPTKFETFNTSFEALDAVRRKVQKAAFGKDAEGYEALGQNIAKDLYKKLASAQESYLGGGERNAQKLLQDNYTEQLANAEKFKTQMGRMALNEDKSPAGIPKAFFKDQQGVQDLKELTGDPQLVDNMAQSYVARTLAGHDSKYVNNWLKNRDNTDWLREVPGMQQRVEAYAKKLQGIEQRESLSAGRVTKYQKEKAGIRETVNKDAAAITDKAQGEAAKVTAKAEKQHADAMAAAAKQQEKMNLQAANAETKQKQSILGQAGKEVVAAKSAMQAKAKAIVTDGMDAPKLYSLLTTGDTTHLKGALQYVAGAPGGKEALEGSVRKAMATVSPAKLEAVWDGRLKPALEAARSLPPETIAKIDKDIKNAYKTMTPEVAQKLSKRILDAALTRASALVTGGGAGAAGAWGVGKLEGPDGQ